ncbi:hypothetical protein ACIG87_14195 [Micromonospora sp. NPDC051925]|uniref:hypothetical protein n=1 Tax=Micromonospora sp. NPDC051925 TaxID=3364288 RepID=UPI0037CA91C4
MITHPNVALLTRYAGGDPGLDEATVWSVEVHLEACPDCRARLAGSTPDDTRALLDRVAVEMDRSIATGPAPVPVRRFGAAVHRRWFIRALLPWLTMTVAVLGCAFLLEGLWPGLPSLVLLLAPVAPLPGVAVAWSRRVDPAWELIAGTPAAGLTMLLRRTAAVLAVVIPVLAVGSAGTQLSVALLLLPCLACTAATIALGGRLGVRRAAAGVAVVWAAAVVLPSMVTAQLSAVLRPDSVPVWALATAVLVAFTATRNGDYRRLSSLS